MIDSKALLADLKRELSALEADLTERAEDTATPWGAELHEEYERAKNRDRTGLSWIDWRNGEVAQAAVAWIIATVFIRFCEDNGLLLGTKRDGHTLPQPWIAAPGDGLDRAVENESAFYTAAPTMTGRDWLQHAFATLAELPAGRTLVDPSHSPVWSAPISASAADSLLAFFRKVDTDGELIHDFSDPDLSTRFLGDLYQDLSDYAKKTFALLQTPDFIEEFILDQTLTPAIQEFGLTGLKLIDPACGSGHFLLGAFDRLVEAWGTAAPGTDRGDQVQRALSSIHGVDLNPFAIAIARFRLTVAALKSSGIASLADAPVFKFHLAIGDSLLGGEQTNAGFDLGDGEYVSYNTEDLTEYAGILSGGQYHVVVANPPYITVKDQTLSERYREIYSTCHRKYALTVPFMELLFKLAKPGSPGSGAGYVGQITSNSFMKREFGKKLVNELLSGHFTNRQPAYVDLTHVVDTSGVQIPGHGTPTLILIGRPRKPVSSDICAVLGVRGEPGTPADPSKGLVWQEIVQHIGDTNYDGSYVSVSRQNRSFVETHPWSLTGGGASSLMDNLSANTTKLKQFTLAIGYSSITGDDEFLIAPEHVARRVFPEASPYVIGASIRDYMFNADGRSMVPLSTAKDPSDLDPRHLQYLWPGRTVLRNRLYFGKTPSDRGLPWWSYAIDFPERSSVDLKLVYSNVGTHNQFAADHSRTVFNAHGQVVVPETANLGADLLGALSTSVACFWLKQVSHNKGGPGGGSSKDEKWRDFYEFTSTNLKEFPLPSLSLGEYALQLDELATESSQLINKAFQSEEKLTLALASAGRRWEEIRRLMITTQEELDWAAYAAYGLTGLKPLGVEDIQQTIRVGERPVEISFARKVSSGELVTRWFDEFAELQTTDIPNLDDATYLELIKRRLIEIETNREIRLLETPDFKRKWESVGWDAMVATAVRAALLDRLETLELWADTAGRPLMRSVAQIADELRHDDRLRELMAIHTGSRDYDLAIELDKLLQDQAVPAFAPLRYKPTGIEKFRAWEQTWELQRAEDRGEQVTAPAPPKYKQTDFLKPSYWSARGKLDVPKERFIAFPGNAYPEDSTAVYGWAGWNHSERGQAIGRFATQVAPTVSETDHDQLVPLVGALVELQPWLDQWYDDMDSRGIKPSTAIHQMTNSLLTRLNTGRDEVLAWRPPAPKRGRKRA